MKDKHDPLAEALDEIPTPALDAKLAETVLSLARGHLAAPPPPVSSAGRLRLTLASALVPGLLAVVATEKLAETVAVVDEVYGADRKRFARP